MQTDSFIWPEKANNSFQMAFQEGNFEKIHFVSVDSGA